MMTPTDSTLSGANGTHLGCLGTLPDRLKDALLKLPARHLALLAACPEKGRSQQELYRDACVLHDAGFDADDQYEIITERFSDYYHEIPERDVHRAIAAAAGKRKSGATWPRPNDALIASVTRDCAGAAPGLWKTSPITEPKSLSTAEVLDMLFEPRDLICLGRRAYKPTGKSALYSETASRADFHGREREFELIVPNPMSAPSGLTQDGRVSSRCLANAADIWTHQVIEFDSGDEDHQAARIRHLVHVATSAGVRLRMVVHSGGKSLHAWFDVSAMPPHEQHKFRRYAAALGADRAMFSICQFARLPNALRRDRGTTQTVKFLDEAPNT